MNKIILKQVVKAVRIRYPNDKFIVCDLETHNMTVTSKEGTKRTEKTSPSDLEYLPMLGELLSFKSVSRIDMDLIGATFTIHGKDLQDNEKIYDTNNPT